MARMHAGGFGAHTLPPPHPACPQLGVEEKAVMCVAADTSVIDALAGMVDSHVPGRVTGCWSGLAGGAWLPAVG